MVVHAGIKAALAILVKGVGSHGQDRGVAVQRIGSDGFGGINTVQVRHLHIHQDQGVAILLGQGYRLYTIVGQINLETDIFQQATRDFLIDRLVFRQKDARAGVLVEQASIGELPGKSRRWRDGVGGFTQTHGKPESTAAA